MDYKERLIAFNSTEKYTNELKFICNLIGNQYSELLDYGCGIGTAVKYIAEHTKAITRGYDKVNYFENPPRWLLESEPSGQYHDITFIHSLAHIDNAGHLLYKLRTNLVDNGRITVITPNVHWIKTVGDTKSDPTVVSHFSSGGLHNLFSELGYNIIQEGQFGEVRNGFNERLFIQVCKDSSL